MPYALSKKPAEMPYVGCLTGFTVAFRDERLFSAVCSGVQPTEVPYVGCLTVFPVAIGDERLFSAL